MGFPAIAWLAGSFSTAGLFDVSLKGAALALTAANLAKLKGSHDTEFLGLSPEFAVLEPSRLSPHICYRPAPPVDRSSFWAESPVQARLRHWSTVSESRLDVSETLTDGIADLGDAKFDEQVTVKKSGSASSGSPGNPRSFLGLKIAGGTLAGAAVGEAVSALDFGTGVEPFTIYDQKLDWWRDVKGIPLEVIQAQKDAAFALAHFFLSNPGESQRLLPYLESDQTVDLEIEEGTELLTYPGFLESVSDLRRIGLSSTWENYARYCLRLDDDGITEQVLWGQVLWMAADEVASQNPELAHRFRDAAHLASRQVWYMVDLLPYRGLDSRDDEELEAGDGESPLRVRARADFDVSLTLSTAYTLERGQQTPVTAWYQDELLFHYFPSLLLVSHDPHDDLALRVLWEALANDEDSYSRWDELFLKHRGAMKALDHDVMTSVDPEKINSPQMMLVKGGSPAEPHQVVWRPFEMVEMNFEYGDNEGKPFLFEVAKDPDHAADSRLQYAKLEQNLADAFALLLRDGLDRRERPEVLDNVKKAIVSCGLVRDGLHIRMLCHLVDRVADDPELLLLVYDLCLWTRDELCRDFDLNIDVADVALLRVRTALRHSSSLPRVRDRDDGGRI